MFIIIIRNLSPGIVPSSSMRYLSSFDTSSFPLVEWDDILSWDIMETFNVAPGVSRLIHGTCAKYCIESLKDDFRFHANFADAEFAYIFSGNTMTEASE